MTALLPRAVLTWVLFIPIAIANGVARESIYALYIGDLTAHQISTVIAIVAYVGLAYVMLRNRVRTTASRSLWLIGVLWVAMTIAFEFGFGHYVDGASWSELLADYNLFAGHVWGLFLLAVLLTPLTVRTLARRGRTEA